MYFISLEPQVLQQYLYPHEDKDDAAGQFRLGLIPAAKAIPRLYAHHGQGKGDHADKGHGGDNVHVQKCKGNAYGQGIDAGCHGEQDNGMAAWNPPKYRPTINAPFQFILGMASPLQTETANASMDSPTAMINSSANDIVNPPVLV